MGLSGAEGLGADGTLRERGSECGGEKQRNKGLGNVLFF